MSEPIKLPDNPVETEFEEYVAAQLQVSGYYLERNIIERDVKDVLELDIILTNYSNKFPDKKVIEVKSGKWGFSEIFKLKGWLDYLHEEQGELIVKKGDEHFEFINKKASSIGIKIKISKGESDQPDIVEDDDYDVFEIASWRYSYWMERELIKILRSLKRENRSLKCCQVANDYYQFINGGIYFYDTTAHQLVDLYDWHKSHSNLTAASSNELINGNYDDSNGINNTHYANTFYKSKINLLQVTSMIEWLAKLQILKCSVDYLLYSESDNEHLADKVEFEIGDIQLKKSDSLPNSFWEGIDYLNQSDNCHKYPLLWSNFIYLLGGFLIKDKKREEFGFLQRKTGLSGKDIDHALNAFDVFFPNSKSWYFEDNSFKLLKMFPSPIRGIGVQFRSGLLIESDQDTLNLVKGQKAKSDIYKWHLSGYQVLKGIWNQIELEL